jgi:hypothetical protein
MRARSVTLLDTDADFKLVKEFCAKAMTARSAPG